MAIVAARKYLDGATTDSGQGATTTDLQTTELHYVVTGTGDEAAAIQAVRATAPATHNGLARGEITVDPTGPTTWDATVQYVGADEGELEVGESSYSFDTGGVSQHITHCLSHIQTYPLDGPDPKGGIGATADSVEGVDITVPVYTWSETHILANSAVNNTYKGKLAALTGKTNDATFKGFAIGEVLFLGASGSRRGKGDWEITFRFAASPNKTGLVVGSITDIAKKGWEYLWVRYSQKEDAAAVPKTMVMQPLAVYIEKVYDAGSYTDLGIGTT